MGTPTEQLLDRFPVVAVVRVTCAEPLPPPLQYQRGEGVATIALQGARNGDTLHWTDPLRVTSLFCESEILCAFQRTEGDPPLVLRKIRRAAAMRGEHLPSDLAAWVLRQTSPVPCAVCGVPVSVSNRADVAWDALQGLVFCERHIPTRHVLVIEVVRGVRAWGEVPRDDPAPGTRRAVDLGLARRGVLPSLDTACLGWEVSAKGLRAAVRLPERALFTDIQGVPRRRLRRCPSCGVAYGSVQASGVCPGCGKPHFADLADLEE